MSLAVTATRPTASPSLGWSGLTPTTYLTTSEAAKIAKISPRTLERLRTLGGGPKWTTAGRAVRYRVDWLDQWLESRAKDAA